MKQTRLIILAVLFAATSAGHFHSPNVTEAVNPLPITFTLETKEKIVQFLEPLAIRVVLHNNSPSPISINSNSLRLVPVNSHVVGARRAWMEGEGMQLQPENRSSGRIDIPAGASLVLFTVHEDPTFELLGPVRVAYKLNSTDAAQLECRSIRIGRRAEPSPLPQEPIAPRVGSDAADDGLRGNIKTIFHEDEDLSGTWSVQGRKPVSMEYYNERGNLIRREFHDYKGNLFEIMVYGYIDGARVASRKTIQREYNPPPGISISPPNATRPKFDPRYSNKFTFQYDDQKRLIEKTWFLNNGELSIRYVYKYSGNQREEFAYSSDGSLNRHYLSILDEKGNEIEETSFETKDGSVRDKYKYNYEFDTHGNWIKRTTLKRVTKEKSEYAPAYVDYRIISYY